MGVKLKSIKIKKKVVIIGIVALAVIGMGVSSYTKAKKAKVKEVTISKVTKKKVVQSVSAEGNVEANYRNDIALNPSQKVVKVLVSEGQQVKKGDILVELDTSEYENQLEKSRLSLASAQSTLNQLLGTEIAADRSNAQNDLAQSQITLENAQRNYEHLSKKYKQNQELLSGGHISQSDFDAAKKEFEDASNAVKSAKATLSKSQVAYGNVNSSNNDKVTAQRNQIASAQADIDNFNKKIEESKLRANTDGIVIKMDAKENQFPKAGDMVIVDDNSLYKISVDMNQYDAVKVVKAQKANIKVKGSDKKYTGQVTDIGEMAQAKTNGANQEYKVNIKVTMDNPDDKVKAGYEADSEIVINEKDNVLTIGFDGIKDEKSTGKKYVYVVNKENKIEKKYIKTGIETEYDVEIKDGLKEGDRYIVNPSENLHEGDVVTEGAKKSEGTKK
ncbi:HlyD family efflux transporter periplasmic adaptor subunit [Clostridium sp. A1-XYC3]|uniref:HlyD family efflux transporter periplasmic adaptor subunit n=1 Tax=Clostridium tanneri TaxID=3037988 RepID=A0ABU4JVM1_9CLOT|nr:HlyD family efflux transporter periplasmic adaptor subunit [Clostridium sp. A1-XYC3]MDW8802205.1 HlyD family efflux transporter periplasmic adaptor subunit [Clostridium sp. A1-XYC3]